MKINLLNIQISPLFLTFARNATIFTYLYKAPRNSNIWSWGVVKELYKSVFLSRRLTRMTIPDRSDVNQPRFCRPGDGEACYGHAYKPTIVSDALL